MEIIKKKDEKKMETLKKIVAEKREHKASPYINKDIYNNYMKGMKERNQKRTGEGLKALHVRTFEEWSGN